MTIISRKCRSNTIPAIRTTESTQIVERRNEIMAEIASLQQELMLLQTQIDVVLDSKSLPPVPLNEKITSTFNALKKSLSKESKTECYHSVKSDDVPERVDSLDEDDEAEKSKRQKVSKERLEMINTAKKKFNTSPKMGIQFLVESGYFNSSEPSPLDIAKFLFEENDMLSKRVLGEYLGDGNSFNIEVFNYFVSLHSFYDLAFDEALRRFLSSFRLPGEAQKIDRMMEKFAERYIECNKADDSILKDIDAAYILAFSIIMLNTDLHNPAVKNKIKKDLFVRNNLDVIKKNGVDVGKEEEEALVYHQYLEALYDKIKSEPLEIANPEKDDPLNNTYFYTFFNPEREGWLIKQGGRIKTWKKRYCILTGSCLYYFKQEASRDFQSEQKHHPCGIIPLENLQVESLDIVDGNSTKKKFFFRLHLSHDTEENSPPSPVEGPKSPSLTKKLKITIKAAKTAANGTIIEGRHSDYLFACDTEGERNDWVNSIRGQMAKPPVYSLYERRKKRVPSVYIEQECLTE